MIYNYEGFLDRIIDSKASKIAMNTVKRKKGAEKYVRRWKVLEALLRPPAFFQHVRLCDLHSVKKTQDGTNREGRRGRGRRGLESSGRGRSWPPVPPRPGSSAPRPLVTHASGRVPGQTEGVRGRREPRTAAVRTARRRAWNRLGWTGGDLREHPALRSPETGFQGVSLSRRGVLRVADVLISSTATEETINTCTSSIFKKSLSL